MICDYCGLKTDRLLGHLYLCIRNAAKQRDDLISIFQQIRKLEGDPIGCISEAHDLAREAVMIYGKDENQKV